MLYGSADMRSLAAEAIMFSSCLLVCPDVCSVVPCQKKHLEQVLRIQIIFMLLESAFH